MKGKEKAHPLVVISYYHILFFYLLPNSTSSWASHYCPAQTWSSLWWPAHILLGIHSIPHHRLSPVPLQACLQWILPRTGPISWPLQPLTMFACAVAVVSTESWKTGLMGLVGGRMSDLVECIAVFHVWWKRKLNFFLSEEMYTACLMLWESLLLKKRWVCSPYAVIFFH